MDNQEVRSYERLLRNLNSLNRSVRQQAVEEVRALSPEALFALVQAEDAHSKARAKRARRQALFGTAIWAILFFLNYLYLSYYQESPSHGFFEIVALLSFLVPCCLVAHNNYARRRTTARCQLAKVIEPIQDARFLLSVVSMLNREELTVSGLRRPFTSLSCPFKTSLRSALKRLLPLLDQEKVTNLADRHKETLCMVLQEPFFDPELSICILRLFERIGYTAALPTLEPLCASRTVHPSRWPVVDVARECRVVLKLHLERQKKVNTLLGAGAGPAAPRWLLFGAGAAPH
jgi:hypothetical protein